MSGTKNKVTPFHKALTNLINTHSVDNDTNVPDFILAEYLILCLESFYSTTKKKEEFTNTNV